jgi:hypothetical protein
MTLSFTKYICSIIYIFIVLTPINTHANTTEIKSWLNLKTKKSFPIYKYYDDSPNRYSGIQIYKDTNNISSQLTLNTSNKKKIFFDNSYLEYNHMNSVIGIGKINRQWSFSPFSSLILSTNARPSSSVYFNISSDKKPKKLFLSLLGPWSFEAFNSLLSNNNGPQNPMLLGFRATVKPLNNLKFELVKTSQWGGKGYGSNISQLSSAILGNTNENKNSEINQLAGLGFSYISNFDSFPLKFYGQFVGEDEAGNLPSCFMSLYGAELTFDKAIYLTKIGFEIIDTRIDYTRNKNCGPNTAYMNGVYEYTNYDTVLGAPIDTESKSVLFWGTTQLTNNININYSTNNIILNDSNWSRHRLSNSKQEGWHSTLGSTWKVNSLTFQSNISYQNYILPMHNISEGLSINFKTTYDF